jgi:integrase
VAEREGRIGRNPAAMIDPPSTKVIHRKPLTIEQAKQILSQLEGTELSARWIACLLQGMRQGECLGLRWKDLDFENETISIRNALFRSKADGFTLITPKSTSSVRVIPMLAPMKYALENTENRGEYVFYGEAVDRRIDWKNWKQLLVETGVCDARMGKGEMPELAAGRTTTGTLLRDAGVDVTIIRDILGHSQVQVTQESYQRTDAKAMRNAMKALENSIKTK